MVKLLNRIRTFDIRKLTPVQWVMIAVGAIIALWILNALLSIVATIMPIVVIVVLAYVAFRVLSSRNENVEEVQKEKREEKLAQADASTRKAAQQVETVTATALAPEASNRLAEPTIDPETGLQQVDLGKLEAEENRRLRQTVTTDPDEIQRQLEERRKRLLGEK